MKKIFFFFLLHISNFAVKVTFPISSHIKVEEISASDTLQKFSYIFCVTYMLIFFFIIMKQSIKLMNHIQTDLLLSWYNLAKKTLWKGHRCVPKWHIVLHIVITLSSFSVIYNILRCSWNKSSKHSKSCKEFPS